MDIEANSSKVRNVVVSVHGIRTFGQWQERLACLIRRVDPLTVTYSYHYGFFSALAFLIPPLRAIEIARFRRHLQRIKDKHICDRISVIGHSFGTHLIGWALAKGFVTHGLPIQQVILAGSVLRSTFDWHALIDKGLVGNVVNDCGIDDNVLLLSQVAVLGTGMAGRLGFAGMSGMQLTNRYFKGGHSHYFVDSAGRPDDAFMVRYWLPLLVMHDEPDEVDQRTNGGPLQGVHVWMIQNADVVKVGSYLTVVFMIWHVFYATPHALADAATLSRARTVALQQIGVDEQTPLGVANLLNIIKRDSFDTTSRELASRWLPELASYAEAVAERGLPALMVWNGRNLLVTQGSVVDLGGAVIESYGFSRDASQLITFDVEKAIRLFQVADGKQLLALPTRYSPEKSDTSEPTTADTEEPDPKVYESVKDLLGTRDPQAEQAERLSFNGELEDLKFRESPDGIYLWGIGRSAGMSVGMTTGVFFAVNRKTLSFAFCEAGQEGFYLLEEGGRLRSFVSYFPEVPDTWSTAEQAQQLATRPAEIMMELIWPDTTNGFGAVGSSDKSTAQPLPADVVAWVKQRGKDDLLRLGINSIARNQALATPGSADPDENERLSPVLIYPNLRPADDSWTVSKLPMENMSSFSADIQAEISHARPLSKEESRAAHQQLRTYVTRKGMEDMSAQYLSSLMSDGDDDEELTLAPQGNRLTYLLRGADGAKYGVTVFCVAKDVSSPVEFCDFIRARGNFVSVAMSDNGRYLAGSDFAGLGQPGLHVRDLATNTALEPDKQPPGGVSFLAFSPGSAEVFASTPYGVWQYTLADGARFIRRYELQSRTADRNKGIQDFGRKEICVSSEQLFHVSSDGVAQALSRKTGLADWLQPLPVTNAQIAFNASTEVVAVYGDQCVHLIHSTTGARIARPLCMKDLESLGAKDGESIRSVQFTADGTLNVLTTARQFSRQLKLKELISQVEQPPFYLRWLKRLGLIGTSKASDMKSDWISRTGHDYISDPVRPLTELPVPAK
jgi:hypothetical protein